jgi:hypothetical protein
MKVNSRSVKISASKIEIEHPLQNGAEVSLRVVGDVVKEEDLPFFEKKWSEL